MRVDGRLRVRETRRPCLLLLVGEEGECIPSPSPMVLG
jgi:hypothetical protein